MKVILILTVLLLNASCHKEYELPREKFIGTWKAINVITNQELSTKVSEGKRPDLMLWSIAGETIELQLLSNNDTIAFQTNFSIPFLIDNSASLTYKSKDSLYGIRSIGSILLPSYKSAQYYITR